VEIKNKIVKIMHMMSICGQSLIGLKIPNAASLASVKASSARNFVENGEHSPYGSYMQPYVEKQWNHIHIDIPQVRF
jgi:hypothetical protein